MTTVDMSGCPAPTHYVVALPGVSSGEPQRYFGPIHRFKLGDILDRHWRGRPWLVYPLNTRSDAAGRRPPPPENCLDKYAPVGVVEASGGARSMFGYFATDAEAAAFAAKRFGAAVVPLLPLSSV